MSYTEHRYSSQDGLSLYYRSYGSGDNIAICLPGMSRNSKDFDDLAEHLSQRWRVICPDFRGRGQSEWDPDPDNYHALSYAKDTWALLDGLGIQRFVVIGTSLGGLVAMVMAQQQNDRLRAVVMNDIAPEIPADAAARIMNYMGRIPPVPDWESAATRARQTYQQALPGLPEEFWLSWVHKSYREDESGKIVPDMDPAIGDALRKSAAAGFDGWNLFRALTMPCLLLRGALSDILTEDTADRMQALKPDLEIVTVPDRGHAPLLNEESSLLAIDLFLDRTSVENDGPARAGDRTTGYIKAIRKDRKINLGLQLPRRSAQEDLCERILAYLEEHEGISTITDYSPPEEIYRQFAVSKGNYKKALGVLYRKRRISVAKDKITLLKS